MAQRTRRAEGAWTMGVLTLAAMLALAAPAARAQMMGGAGSTPLFSGAKPKASARAAPPPSALPGARASKVLAPAAVGVAGMSPNAALFDAINRDDLAAARDALNRGAELQAHNVLGMTPLQLSIDLGRNDITFLLLSMGAADAGAGGAPGAGPQAPRAAVLTGRPVAGKSAAGPAPRARAVVAARVAPARVAPASAVPARLAGNGGTPVPSAGFLGFDPSR